MVDRAWNIPSKYPCPFLLTDLGLIVLFLEDWVENSLVPISSSDFQQHNAPSLSMSLKNPLLILTMFSVYSYLTDL